MNDWFWTFIGRRYALGGVLLLWLLVFLTWKFFEVGASYPLGLLRSYAVLLLLFSPWFLLTFFTRLHVAGDQVRWREFPFPRSFSLEDVTAITRVDAGRPDNIPRLRIEYTRRGGKRQAHLTPFVFPKADVRTFLKTLSAMRPDLSVPDFPLEPERARA